ncbi:maleylacetate reductase [Metarhizium robertsii ARSEF 23]|uniref:Maleylacetate reductase n=2 Tax=Metarhizium robertsii TaxID=568076 RepID=E9F1T7_METRA|nr:maleylacetate reductase [Metarhizium robertsii ARSEF 23]EFY98026.1 maleylacetate reductase [Metarhizium robertsii ARSEF 23]
MLPNALAGAGRTRHVLAPLIPFPIHARQAHFQISAHFTNKMKEFEYNVLPSRVIFGSGSVKKLPAEIERLNVSRPLLLATPGKSNFSNQLSDIIQAAAITIAGTFPHAKAHTPTSVTEEATAFLASVAADCVVSIGGGSVVGLGKAVSIRTGVPHISIPTTYSGSEMTPILGETQNGKKTTRSDPRILPAVVIYDADFTMTLPPAICSTSGINAIAHAVEALYATNANPITSTLALEGIKALAAALPQIVRSPESKAPREEALYGAWLCGAVLGSSSMGLHHKLCHVLGGSFALPHAETHTVVLPHALSYNAPAIPEQMAKLATVFPGSNGDALRGLELLLQELGVPRALKDLGMEEGDIEKATEIAAGNQYPNPRPLEKQWIRELIRRAWAGETAKADLCNE